MIKKLIALFLVVGLFAVGSVSLADGTSQSNTKGIIEPTSFLFDMFA